MFQLHASPHTGKFKFSLYNLVLLRKLQQKKLPTECMYVMVAITFIISSTCESLEGTGSCTGVWGGKSCVPANWPIGRGNADKGEFEDSISAGALLFKALISDCIPPSALSNLAVTSLSTALQSTLLTFFACLLFFVVKFVFLAFHVTNQCSRFHLTSCSFCFSLFFVISSSLTSLCLQMKSFWSAENGQSGVVGILLSRGRTKVTLPHKVPFFCIHFLVPTAQLPQAFSYCCSYALLQVALLGVFSCTPVQSSSWSPVELVNFPGELVFTLIELRKWN